MTVSSALFFLAPPTRRTLVAGLVAGLALACNTTRVESTAAPDTDWARFERFTVAAATAQPLDQQIVTELRAALLARGLTESAEDADLAVTYRLTLAQRTQRKLAPEPDANTYREVTVLEKSLVVEARDARTQAILWTGRGTTPIRDAEETASSVPAAVEAIFASFPLEASSAP